MIQGMHRSKNVLVKGDIIISNQHTFSTYEPIWKAYKEVADEMGLNLPHTFGYAYPIDSPIASGYEVETEYAIAGNCQKSIFYTMFLGANRFIRDVPRSMSIEERHTIRHERLKEWARGYFNPINLNSDEKIELISDTWTVK